MERHGSKKEQVSRAARPGSWLGSFATPVTIPCYLPQGAPPSLLSPIPVPAALQSIEDQGLLILYTQDICQSTKRKPLSERFKIWNTLNCSAVAGRPASAAPPVVTRRTRRDSTGFGSRVIHVKKEHLMMARWSGRSATPPAYYHQNTNKQRIRYASINFMSNVVWKTKNRRSGSLKSMF